MDANLGLDWINLPNLHVHFQSSVWVWSVAFGDALCSYQHLAASSANDVAVSAQNQKSQLEKAKHSAHGLDVLNLFLKA